VLEDLGGQRVAQRQLGEHVGIGRIPGLRPAQRRQLELLEEDLRELLRRGDREFLAGQVVDLAREVVEVALQLLGEHLEPRGSTRMPVRSISASTGTSGRSISS